MDWSLFTAPERFYGYIPKLQLDIEFVTEYYSAIAANEFATFYVNLFLVVHLVLIALLILRLTVWRRKPFGFDSGVTISKKILYVFCFALLMTCLTWFFPSFFREANEISTVRFPPGLRALAVTSFFQSAYAMTIYLAVVTPYLHYTKSIYGEQDVRSRNR